MKTGFYLCGNTKHTGKTLFWPCTGPVRDCSAWLSELFLFFYASFTFSNFNLNCYILFLLGLLFSFYSWTFFPFPLGFPFGKFGAILFYFSERPIMMSDFRGEGRSIIRHAARV